MAEETTAHHGSCHCGAVSFVLQGAVRGALRCTCSICRRVGALWHPCGDADLTILTGEDSLALYQFGTRTARHYFCPTCGIHPFSRPRLDPSKWVVNLRCIPDLDIDALPLQVFDGANWEAAAAALLKGRP